MKRLLNLIVTFAMVLSLVACGNSNSNESTELSSVSDVTSDDSTQDTQEVSTEIKRAIAFGLVPEEIQGDYDKIITFRQYVEMLNNFMYTYDESRFGEWKETMSLAAESDAEMAREDGILAIAYAMVHMGKIEYSGHDWAFFDMVGEYMDTYGYDLTWDYPMFPNWEDLAFEWINSNYIQGGLHMCAAEKSHVSGLAIYPYDFEREGKHFKDSLTREEAICAVLRFAETEDIYANNIPVLDNIDYSASESKLNKINDLAAERKQNILNNTESVSCTGTAYYISNSGDDSNDGTSPETAWATLDKVKSFTFQPGDGIYFERGGIWRGAVGYFVDSITISSYGSGEKPRIYGSPENGGDTDKWELYSDANGVKIWEYTGTALECAGIVLNNGESVAKRVYAWYDGNTFYDSADRVTPFDMNTALCEDLYFYCDMNSGAQQLPYRPDWNKLSFKIYLRCDNGNPGELFNSIEFISRAKTEDVAALVVEQSSTIDNICFMYHAGTTVFIGDGCTVQNCEFGWNGTRLEQFFMPEEDEPGIWTDGNEIHLIASNCIVQNNFIHDVDGGGIVLELGGDISDLVPFRNNNFSSNLIERCGDPLYIRNNDEDEEVAEAFGEMTIDNNIILDTGYGWYENQPSYINPAFYTGHSQNVLNYYGEAENDGQSVKVTNNIFCRAYHSLMYFSPTTDNPSCEDNNIYVQNYGKTVVETSGAMVKATQPDEIYKGLESLHINSKEIIVLKPE